MLANAPKPNHITFEAEPDYTKELDQQAMYMDREKQLTRREKDARLAAAHHAGMLANAPKPNHITFEAEPDYIKDQTNDQMDDCSDQQQDNGAQIAQEPNQQAVDMDRDDQPTRRGQKGCLSPGKELTPSDVPKRRRSCSTVTKETTKRPMPDSVANTSPLGVFGDPSQPKAIEEWIVWLLRPFDAMLAVGKGRERVKAALLAAVTQFAEVNLNGTIYVQILPTGRLAREMQSLLPVILHLSTGDLAQAFVDRLWYHARQITLEGWKRGIKRSIKKKRKVGKIPDEFFRQGNEHEYKSCAGNHSSRRAYF
jgi:hypothetical protein